MKSLVLNLFLLIICYLGFAQAPSDFTFPVRVVTNGTSSEVLFKWQANDAATKYTLKRRLIEKVTTVNTFEIVDSITTNANTAVQFVNRLTGGKFWEYQIEGTFSAAPNIRNAYLCVGFNVPQTVNRGTIILLCDSSIIDSLTNEINVLTTDLYGDGWKVKKIGVNRSNNPASVIQVKNKIKTLCATEGDVSQILIIGHVPVPYSGLIYPDGHSEHYGAWPADGYYGDIDSIWTDTLINNTFATRPENRNIINDGKFDQSLFKQVNIAVGRVDFSNLPEFTTSEIQLYKRYFNKNHLYRTAFNVVEKRALIEDNLLSFNEKFSQSAWKSFNVNVGVENVIVGQYETDLLLPEGYLFSFGCGGGTYTSANGILSTSNFATGKYFSIFTQLFGSYFGDWDTQNNLLRSAIASQGTILCSFWGGRPHWYLHHLGAGYPIGYSTLATMNNKNTYTNTGYGNTMVHAALMGDPSLRSSYLKPVQHVTALVNAKNIDINWTASDEVNLIGYNIYKSNTISGNFELLNTEIIVQNFFVDTLPYTGKNVYMVRAVKLETILKNSLYYNSSSFYNMSTGVFDSTLFYNIVLPIGVYDVTATAKNCAHQLKWKIDNKQIGSLMYIEVANNSNGTFKILDTIQTNTTSLTSNYYQYTNNATANGVAYYYRVKYKLVNGYCYYSSTVFVPSVCNTYVIQCYPNPAINTCTLVIPSHLKQATCIVLYNASGKKVLQQKINEGKNTLLLAACLAGNYTGIVYGAGTKSIASFTLQKL